MSTTFAPDWASPPGITICHAMAQKRMSRSALAEHMGRDCDFVDDLLAGQRQITSDVAKILAASIGSSEDFWLARESKYRRAIARILKGEMDANPTSWLSALPVEDMVKFGWVSVQTGERVTDACKRFFGLDNETDWQHYESQYVDAAFRASAAFETNPAAVAAWLRKGEIEASKLRCRPWCRRQFGLLVPSLRKLTRVKSPKIFLPRLQKLCAETGVAVVVVRAPTGCRASGAAKMLASGRALILLSTRYQTDDHFWFSFFHEAGHLINDQCENPFIDGIGEEQSDAERRANAYASRTLITPVELEALTESELSYRTIIRFAMKSGVAPGIVAAQLQSIGTVDRSWFNRTKRKLDWTDIAA